MATKRLQSTKDTGIDKMTTAAQGTPEKVLMLVSMKY